MLALSSCRGGRSTWASPGSACGSSARRSPACSSGIQRATFFQHSSAGRDGRGQSPSRADGGPASPQRARGARAATGGSWWQAACRQRIERAEAEAAPTNWRPLCSYTANLQRLGEALLNTDAAWVEIGRAIEVPRAALQPFFRPRRAGEPDRRDQRAPPRRSDRAAVSVDMVGRRPGRPVGTFAMDFEHAREVAGPAAVTPVVEFDGVSKWYGNVIGLNKLTRADSARRHRAAGPQRGRQVHPAATGHRATPAQPGKRARPRATGAWNNPALMRHVGLCPEQDAFYEWMTGYDFVRTCARLTGMGRREAAAAAEKALAIVGMTEHMRRPIRGYSKGMRQRTKLAQALVHEPRVLLSGRALHRHRSGGPARPAGSDPRPGRDRAQRGGLQPHPARGRGADAEHHPLAPRPAGGRGPGAARSAT